MTTPRARQQAAIVSASGRVGATRGRAWARGGGGAIAGYGSVEAALHETLGPIGPNLQLPVMAAAAGPASQRVSYKSSSPMPWRSSPSAALAAAAFNVTFDAVPAQLVSKTCGAPGHLFKVTTR